VSMTEPMGDAEAIIETAIRSTEPHEIDPDAVNVLVVPDGGKHEVIDLRREERHLAQPRRKRGTVQLRTAASLIQYAGVHDVADGRSALFADRTLLRVVGVFNGPNTHEPGWADHRAVLQLQTTPEWAAWMGRNGIVGNQVEFAEHIEDRLTDIAEPPGATLLELAQTFEATTSAAFRSAHRLQDGQIQLRYEEQVDAKAGSAGDMTIPPEFTLVLAPFEGTEPRPIRARLRYRVSGGNLRIGYILNRPDDVLREAFDEVLIALEQGTGLTPYHGTVDGSGGAQ
jgi:uncharacterized protein YfdQ (DUF2303 family)